MTNWKAIAVVLACCVALLATNARIQYTLTNAFIDTPAK